MTILTNYNAFSGRHWETGSVHNFYSYRGVNAPHTGKPPSEALLLGVSGGIVFGYFSFVYDGYDPILALLSRNTFDPLDKMLSRLGVVQTVMQTSSAEKGRKNLLDALNDGTSAIVWADVWSLPYNGLPYDEGMWGMQPLVVYGLDEEAHIADQAAVGLRISADDLQTARARVKKNKFRVLLLEAPDWSKLSAAVTAGIWDTIRLFTEKPPKGGRNSFGFAAYQHWIKLLTKSSGKQSWDKNFPTGIALYAGLTEAVTRTSTFGQARCGADRQTYADFLDEASVILERPELGAVGEIFRESAEAWCKLNPILLPDGAPPLAEARQLLLEKRRLFIEEGQASNKRRAEISERLSAIRDDVRDGFPLDSAEVSQLKQHVAEQVQVIHDIERRGINALIAAM